MCNPIIYLLCYSCCVCKFHVIPAKKLLDTLKSLEFNNQLTVIHIVTLVLEWSLWFTGEFHVDLGRRNTSPRLIFKYVAIRSIDRNCQRQTDHI